MQKSKFIKWLVKKFQIVFYHGNSYTVIRKINFNRLGFLGFIFFVFVLFFAVNSLIIVYTPAKRLVPGYPNAETRRLIMENAIRTDSLAAELEKRDIYINAIRNVLLNEIPIDEEYVVSPSILTKDQIKNFNNPLKPRERIEDFTNYVRINERIPDLFPPLKGLIVSKHNIAQRHYGVDIAGINRDDVYAVYSGIVVLSEYTLENGYSVIIQHKSGFISVYKHLSEIIVQTGQSVVTGQLIGKFGNSGENTSGPHLHFEIWDKGKSLNPEDYIIFE